MYIAYSHLIVVFQNLITCNFYTKKKNTGQRERAHAPFLRIIFMIFNACLVHRRIVATSLNNGTLEKLNLSPLRHHYIQQLLAF